MAEDEGVNVTRHEIRTEDGYLLTLHRVGNPRGTPVLLVHGLLASSDQWLLLNRAESYRKSRKCFAFLQKSLKISEASKFFG